MNNKQFQTFEVTDGGPSTGVGDEPTGFSWIDTMSEPEDPHFAVESPVEEDGVILSDPAAAEPGHRDRFNQLLGAAVRSPKSSG